MKEHPCHGEVAVDISMNLGNGSDRVGDLQSVLKQPTGICVMVVLRGRRPDEPFTQIAGRAQQADQQLAQPMVGDLLNCVVEAALEARGILDWSGEQRRKVDLIGVGWTELRDNELAPVARVIGKASHNSECGTATEPGSGAPTSPRAVGRCDPRPEDEGTQIPSASCSAGHRAPKALGRPGFRRVGRATPWRCCFALSSFLLGRQPLPIPDDARSHLFQLSLSENGIRNPRGSAVFVNQSSNCASQLAASTARAFRKTPARVAGTQDRGFPILRLTKGNFSSPRSRELVGIPLFRSCQD